MASEHFWYNPTTGSGNTQVSVSADTMNGSQADRLSTLTFTAGSASKTVSVRQKYMPYKQQFASTTFPATGGNIYFTVHSEYDVVFRSVPDWITISRNSTVYSEGQRISSGVVDNQTFTLTAEANTGETRSVGATMNMAHYIGDEMQHYYSYFSFTQEGQGGTKDMILSPTGATVDSARTSYTIYVPTTSCTFCGMTYTNSNADFPVTAVKDGSYIRLTYSANTGDSRTTLITFTLRDENNNPYYKSFSLAQEAAAETESVEIEWDLEARGFTEPNRMGITISCESGTEAHEYLEMTASTQDDAYTTGAFDALTKTGETLVIRLTLNSSDNFQVKAYIDYNNYTESAEDTLLAGGYVELETPYVPGAMINFRIEPIA